MGSGPPLVLPAWWVSHLELDWQQPAFRSFLETLATQRTVIRYDPPGAGMSDGAKLGLEGELLALEAVMDDAGVERGALLGISSGACVAVAFASRLPARVEALVLYGGYPAGDEVTSREARDAILAAVRSHWGVGSRLLADVFLPEATGEELADFARFQREAASPEAAAEHLGFVYSVDVREELPQIEAPTLVVHRRDDRAIPAACGQELAATIPGARLQMLDGSQHLPWRGDAAAVAAAVGRFLDGREPVEAGVAGELSAREIEVLRLVADGLSDAEIAERLVLSEHTVHRHVANIRAKLRQPSRAAAVAHAARRGLI
ncbi:MAG TPA: alpha/beta fold hydrolase [Thermoleophilaceae bacterium]|nr:alpha/beta fold hydrolase [Thermoleophilaceae bacterium]